MRQAPGDEDAHQANRPSGRYPRARLPAMRVRDKDRTRAALVAAGERVASEGGLAGLSIQRVISEADSSKGSFFHHFDDRTAFVIELHRAFHERRVQAINAAIEGVPAGRE